jgi:mono/diheme cytochrome c family protein
MNRRILATVATACLLAAVTATASAEEPAPKGNVKTGQRVYLSVGCWECHGTVAQGGAISGPRLAATKMTYEAFVQQVRVPVNAMPPYEAKILSDADARNIYAFLESLPKAPSAKDIPLLSGE